MKNINNLPDLILRNVFSRLDLFELIKSSFICQQWRQYQFEITSKVKSLTILLGSKNTFEVIPKSIFTIPYLEDVLNEANKPMFPLNETKNCCLHIAASPPCVYTNQVVRSFPSVTKLQIVINGIDFSDVTDFFVQLLLSWSEKLTKLEVFFRSNSFCKLLSKEEDIYIRQEEIKSTKIIMSMISMCGSLKHLTVDCDTYFYLNQFKNIFDLVGDLPPNLETLRFKTLDNFTESHLIAFRKYLTDNEQLKHLALMNTTAEAMDHPNWLQFSSLWIKIPAYIKYWNDSIMTNFSSLTSIEIKYRFGRDFIKLLQSLSPLKDLLYLCLDIGSKEDTDVSHSLDISKYDSVSYSTIIQLTSVKVLKLKIRHLKYHFDVKSRIWSWVFPNVQVVIVKHKCIKYCHHYKSMQMKPELTEDSFLTAGIRTLIKTFKQCPTLRYVYTNYPEKRRWQVSELE